MPDKEKEIRQLTTDFEVRSIGEDNQEKVIEGYALKFNSWSETLGGWFKETIRSDALDNSNMDNVVALFNHSDDKVLGRVGINLELEVDEIGLKFRVKPTKTTYANDLIENMRSGIINQCSFAMSDVDADWDEPEQGDGPYKRTIRSIGNIWDVSIVTNPAYSNTEATVGTRSLEQVDNLMKKEQEVNELEWLEIEVLQNML